MYNDNERLGSGGSQAGGSHVQGKLTTLYKLDYPGNHLFSARLMHQEQEKDYKSPYFVFVRIFPKGGNTYITEHHITFVMSFIKFGQLAAYLGACGNGTGVRLGEYRQFADTSKAANRSEGTDIRTSKTLSIAQLANNGGNGHVVMMTFGRGKQAPVQQSPRQGGYQQAPQGAPQANRPAGYSAPPQQGGNQGQPPAAQQPRGGGYDNIALKLLPAEAIALAGFCGKIAHKAFELDMELQLNRARKGFKA
ncbi:MAG: hypothetical protein KKB70_00385 [Proteobacteria bacterium]|nr:hypothetical protein [Pseudomonadota bacterium]